MHLWITELFLQKWNYRVLVRNFSTGRLRVRPQLGERRQGRSVCGRAAPLKPERKRLYLVHEYNIVELDQVAPLFAVDDRRSSRRTRWRWRRWKLGGLRGVFGGFFGLGRLQRTFGMKEDRSIDVACSLGLVLVVLHDVGEVDTLPDHL